MTCFSEIIGGRAWLVILFITPTLAQAFLGNFHGNFTGAVSLDDTGIGFIGIRTGLGHATELGIAQVIDPRGGFHFTKGYEFDLLVSIMVIKFAPLLHVWVILAGRRNLSGVCLRIVTEGLAE